jgi:hypothetical protein
VMGICRGKHDESAGRGNQTTQIPEANRIPSRWSFCA